MNHTISVTGNGSAAATPSLAIVDIGVEVLAKSVVAARSAAAADMGAVIESLRSNGLGDSDLVTTSYSINPEYDHRDGRRLRGYRVANMVEARIKALDSIGEIIDAAAGAGSEHAVVRGLRFVHEDESGLAATARASAWADAQAKAEQLAELAGVELGRVVAMSEQRGHGGGPPMRAMAMESAMGAPIEAGELASIVAIHVEFAIGTGS